MTNQPRLPSAPPVTVQVGVPVIDIPGCVEAHIDNKKGTNDNLVEDDSKGARVFCDGNMPSFNPIDYNPEELKYEQPPPKPPVVRPPETPAPPEVPKDAVPKVEEKENLLVLDLMLCVLVMWHRTRRERCLVMNCRQ